MVARMRFLLPALLVACGPAASVPASAVAPLEASWQTALPASVTDALDRAAATHDVFGIGEGDHYVHEKYGYRLALVRRLHAAHGLRHFGLEMGASDAARIDRYLQTGDETWLHRIALYGYRGETDDEKRELAPVTRGTRRPCDDAWAEDERRFWRDLRQLGEVHVFGFDHDAVPGGGYLDARTAATNCGDEALRARLTPPRGTSGSDELQRLDALARDLSALGPACSGVHDAIEQLAFSYRTFFEWQASMADTSAGGPDRVRRMFAAREEQMFARFLRWRTAVPAGTKVALFAHDMHVARDSEALHYGRGAHRFPMWQSLGARIALERPGSLWVSWLLYGQGSRYTPSKPSPWSEVALRGDTVEAELASSHLGGTFVFVDRLPPGSLVDRALPFGTETSEGFGPIRSSTDAIVFLPAASAAPGCR